MIVEENYLKNGILENWILKNGTLENYFEKKISENFKNWNSEKLLKNEIWDLKKILKDEKL